MLNPQVLNKNSFGCVVTCSCCDKIHICFGSLLLVFSYIEFKNFSKSISHIFTQRYREICNTGEYLYFQTGNESIHIMLNAQELKLLNELFAETFILQEAREIVKTSGK